MKSAFFFVLLLLSTGMTGFSQASVIENVNIIDVKSGEVVTNQTVVVQNEKIADIGSASAISYPQGARVINGSGKYLMPGMIDAHVHFFQSGGLYTRPDAIDLTHRVPYEEELDFTWNAVRDYFRRYLRLGVTTIIDVGGPFQNFDVRDSLTQEYLAPNVLVTGPLFSSYQPSALTTDDPPIIKVSSKEEAEALFNEMLTYKPDFIKVWYIVSANLPAEATFPIVEHINKLAEEHGLPLAVHATQLETARLAIKAGADILVHSVSDRGISEKFIEELKENEVTYIPTLIVSGNYSKTYLSDPNRHAQDIRWANPFAFGTLFEMEALNEGEMPRRVRRMRQNPEGWYDYISKFDSIVGDNLLRITKAGVNVATGTDAGNIGTMHASSYLQELEAMQRAGLSNAEILKASTINAAQGFGKEGLIGSIEKGKLADLVLLDSNPLEDLQHLNDIHMVFKSGQALEPDKLIKETPEMLVQRQLNAYNSRDIDAFLDTYAEDVKIYTFPDQLIMEGREGMRQNYAPMFANTPNLFCEIKNRIILGNKVIDKEYVRVNDRHIEAIAVYEVANGFIQRVTFIRKD